MPKEISNWFGHVLVLVAMDSHLCLAKIATINWSP
jgi:hypothetical protein